MGRIMPHLIFLYLFIVATQLLVQVSPKVIEAPDGSVCFNNCNGHGTCVNYVCQCFPGYSGDDCKHSFLTEEMEKSGRVIPILSAGHFNLTKKNFTETVTQYKSILVGFSSYTCHKCIQLELEYERIAHRLSEFAHTNEDEESDGKSSDKKNKKKKNKKNKKKQQQQQQKKKNADVDLKEDGSNSVAKGIPFGRVDANALKSIAIEHGAVELPSLVFFHNSKPYPYRGVQSVDAVTAFIDKIMGPPTTSLTSVQEVTNFMQSRTTDVKKYSISTTFVVGFFSDHEEIEEDEYNDFQEIAEDMKANEDVYFAEVTSPKVAKFFKANKTIDRTPSVLLVGESGILKSINLDEMYDEKLSLKDWVAFNAIPLVGKLTHQNFRSYEKIPRPMLMLFLDLSNEHLSSNPGAVVGGKSGGILNELLLEEFRKVAKEHSDKFSFVYLDGNLHEDQMRSLGLYGGKERLPSLAFNTREGLQVPFPEELPINADTLLQFCADFISGKLRSAHDAKEMAKKALQSAIPINQKNKATRKERRSAPKQVQGVSEQYGDGRAGDDAVVQVNLKNFDEVVMSEDKDVLFLLHAQSCEPCSHFAVYFKRMAKRFKDLNIPSLVIAVMDVTNESPPAHLNMMATALPVLIMLPAGAKHPPWNLYSGVGKMQQMMRWVQQQASIPFELPHLPHLTDEQKELYKQQVREREEALDKRREQEKKDMEEQTKLREETYRKLREKKEKEEEEELRRQEQEIQQQQQKVEMDEL